MIEHGKDPSVFIDSDTRKASLDWLTIVPRSNSSPVAGHALSIVGFGSDVDPYSIKYGEYDAQPTFILRDSFVPEPRPYEVSAQNLMEHLEGIHKIISVDVSK